MAKFHPKILIVGWGRSGKDEAGAFLNSIGLPYGGSTSWNALPDVASALRLHPQIAWETRHKNREFWKSFCDKLRADDPCLLARRALREGCVVTGVRDLIEIDKIREEKLFDHILWINRPGTPPDSTVTFGPEKATEIIENDGSLPYFHWKLYQWCRKKSISIKQINYI